MPYVFEERSKGTIDQEAWSSTNGSFRALRAKDYEAVFSHRSSVPPLGKVSSESSISNDLVENLKYRRRSLEGLLDDVSGRSGGPTHFANADVGHAFGVVKIQHHSAKNGFKGTYDSATNCVPNRGFFADASGNIIQGSFPDVGANFFTSKGCTALIPVVKGSPPIAPVINDWTPVATCHIAEMNPLKSKVNLAVTIAELARGDIPSLTLNLRKHIDSITRLRAEYRTFSKASKAIGGGYLGWVFGWAPIISDVTKALGLLVDTDAALFANSSSRRQLKRPVFSIDASSSGRETWAPVSPHVGASGLMWDPIYTPKVDGSRFVPAAVGMPTDVAAYTRVDVKTSARYLTGAVPTVENNNWLSKGIDLLGLKITPELLWELTPWSWLVDWFSGIGRVLQNISTLGLDGALLNYAYSTIRVKHGFAAYGRPNRSGSVTYSGSFAHRATFDAKVRRAASPYGFSVAWNQLNAGQIAILTALGLARQR